MPISAPPTGTRDARPSLADRSHRAVRPEADEPDPVILPIEDSLDLHAFAPRDIPSVVDEYLREAAARGFAEVRLIHGRGKGVQRAVVQRLLAGHPLVSRFYDGPPERGGWGATVAVL